MDREAAFRSQVNIQFSVIRVLCHTDWRKQARTIAYRHSLSVKLREFGVFAHSETSLHSNPGSMPFVSSIVAQQPTQEEMPHSLVILRKIVL